MTLETYANFFGVANSLVRVYFTSSSVNQSSFPSVYVDFDYIDPSKMFSVHATAEYHDNCVVESQVCTNIEERKKKKAR